MRPIVVHRPRHLTFNLTPMIDVVFQLIIFFLCVNQFERADRDERTRLPEAQSPDVGPNKTTTKLVVSLDGERGLVVDDRPVSAERLVGVVADRRKKSDPAELEVWIRADRDSPYSIVEPILLACAKAGVGKIAFQVVRAEGVRPEASP